jgi:hypothetical protein
MSVLRHEIRQISEENRGQPIISQAVIHGNVAYFAGITPNPIVGGIKTQTDPPPMKWSDSKYGIAIEEDCNGEEAQAGRDRCEVAAG